LFLKRFLMIGTLTCASAVAAGAFGAHGLKAVLSQASLNTYGTAVEYQFFHGFALIVLASLANALNQKPNIWFCLSASLFCTGLILFCGSLYVLAFGGPSWFGPITPIGGLSFILAWCLFMCAIFKSP